MSFYLLLRRITGLSHVHKKVLDYIGELPKGSSILDVGCGKGALLADLYKEYGEGYSYMGIDPDHHRLDIARKYLPEEIILKRAYANSLPVVPGSMDIVVCSLAFHHIPKSDWETSLAEILRVLKPGGRLIFTEFGEPSGLGWLLAPFNPCRSMSKGLLDWFLSSIVAKDGYLASRSRQFGYIEHMVVSNR